MTGVRDAGDRVTLTRLTIRSIETIPIRVPLARTYRGSGYKMTHRSTLLTRVVTEEGLVGEAYAGDEDAGLAEIDAIITSEIARARHAAGDDFVLAADANQAWTPQQAIAFARLVEDCDLLWFEEPCRWHNDRRAMRDVRLAAGVRVCAGQSELSAGGCLDLMLEGAIDVCNFDPSW